MSRLEEALEAGLRGLAEGKSLEECLPEALQLREDVRPLLQAALRARQAAYSEMAPDARRRVRSQFLQRAAKIRESRVPRRLRIIPALPRTAITLGLVAVLALTSTGLVRASSGAVPGDQLYSIKRSWEDIQLLLTSQPAAQYMLASEFEQERLDEIEELLARGRTAPIAFSGVVNLKSDGKWIVSGIPVYIPAASILALEAVGEGQPVLVTGGTRADGSVEADAIELLAPGAALPPLAPSVADDHEKQQEEQSSKPEVAPADEPASGAPQSYIKYQFTGIVERLGESAWQVNRQHVTIQDATIIGSIKVGDEIKFEGYYTPTGTFVATRIEGTTNLRHDDGREEPDGGQETQSDAGSGGTDSGDETEHEGGD